MVHLRSLNPCKGTGVRAASVAIALAWTLAFAYSFAPFDVSLGLGRIEERVPLAGPARVMYVLDLILHALAFAAVGVVERISTRHGDGDDPVVVRVLARDVVLCVFVEAAQMFLPSRHAAFADLAANVLGLTLGHLSGSTIVRHASAPRLFGRRALRNRNARIVYLAVWGLVWSAAILVPSRLVALESWDPTYPLLVGGEKSGERPWRGELRYVAFYGGAVTADEVNGPLSIPPTAAEGKRGRVQAGLLAAYDFTQPNRLTIEAEGF
jgi:VanZ family protein